MRIGVKICMVLLLYVSSAMAQDSVQYDKKGNVLRKEMTPSNAPSKKYIPTERNISNYKSVEDAIQNNDDDRKYNEYIILADKLSREKRYNEANGYLNKALEYFIQEKNKNKQAEIRRKIALNNEFLQNEKDAIEQYQKAKDIAPDPQVSRNIQNNIDRVESSQNSIINEVVLEKQIEEINTNSDKVGLNASYKQLADVALQNKDTVKAINALIESTKATSDVSEKIELQDQLADIYASSDSIGKAIQLTIQTRESALEMNDWMNYVNQSIKLSEYYVQSSKNDSAVIILETTLTEAYKHNNTQAILILVKALKDHYDKLGMSQMSDWYLDSMLSKLWSVALVDTNIYQDALYNEVTKRIELLEKDQERDRLMYKRTNTFNIILIIVSSVLVLAFMMIIIALKKLKKKNHLIQLQSLRREMNPHFIFNALNSVNLFIANNDERAANKYLTSYSSLMRNILSTSNKNFIPLHEEILALRRYVELEHMRFEDHFDYEIDIEDALQDNNYFVPNMLLQPFVENAIWHGLRYKSTKGFLKISFKKYGDKIQAIIEDNGIGYEQSQALKSKNQKHHQSIGIHNTTERIRLLNIMFGVDIDYKTSYNDEASKSGHRVIISWSNKIDAYEK